MARILTEGRPWLGEEVEFLKNNYGRMYDRNIARKLNRTRSSIRSKKYNLGLARFKKLPEFKFNDYEIGLLVGLLEGEGSVYLTKRLNRRARLGFILQPMVDVSNTKFDLIKRISELLPVGLWRYYKRPNPSKECYTYKIFRIKDIYQFLKMIEPALVSNNLKKKVALMVEFCGERLGGRRNTPYSERAVEIYRQIKELNKRGVRT